MTLDDERTNWHHYEQIERGVLPEVEAATRVASMLGRHIPPAEVSEAAVLLLASKVIAHRHALIPLFAQVDADPRRLGEARTVRRQQQHARLDDMDFFLEEAAYHKNAYERAVDVIDRITARRLAEHDPDVRGADEDDRRVSRERADADAASGMPKGMAS